MPYTSWRRIDSFAGGEVQAREYASFSRTNNTLYVSGFKSQWRVTIAGSDTSIVTYSYMSSGTNRKTTNFGSRSWSAWDVFNGSSWSGSIGVSSGTSSISTRTRWGDYSGSWYNSTANFSIPTVSGASYGAPTFSNVGTTTATVKGTISSWGTNCTAGQGVRFGVWWPGKDQFYNSRTTSSSPSWNLTGLPSNTNISADMDVVNGAGISNDGANGSTVTKPLAPTSGIPVIEATTATIPVYINTGGGHYSITKQYRYQQVGGAWSNWTTYTGSSITLENLTPGSDYNFQLRSTTTAGTTTGSVISLLTLPAGKIVLPDGSVQSAVPHLVMPDGTVRMCNVATIRSESSGP